MYKQSCFNSLVIHGASEPHFNFLPMEENNKLSIIEYALPVVLDVEPKQVEWIAKVRQSPARSMEPETVQAEIARAIVSIAAYVTPPETYIVNEFAAAFKEAYPNLNPMECAAAVRMQMTGKLGESDNRIFYAGKFNISTMFSILNEYLEWRKNVVAAIITAEDEVRREEERKRQKMAWIAALEVDKAAFLRGEYGELNSWQDIPAEWFDWAMAANLFTWEKGEKQRRVDQAKQEAENELKAQNENNRRSGRISEVLKGAQFTSSIEARSRIIQRKRAVWDKLVNQPAPG